MKPQVDQDTVMELAMFTPYDDIKALFAGRESVSVQEIASWKIYDRDRVIILTCVLSPQYQRLFSVECVELIRHMLNDPQVAEECEQDISSILRWISDLDTDPRYAALYSTIILDLVGGEKSSREKQLSRLLEWHTQPEESLESQRRKTDGKED